MSVFCRWVTTPEGYRVYMCEYKHKKTLTLGERNRKIGEILNFSIPPDTVIFTTGRVIRTCPGATHWCRTFCYAKKNRMEMPNVMSAYASNLVWYLELGPDKFAEKLERALRKLEATGKYEKILRVHVAGDFFEKDYIEMWRHIAERMPDWRFYTYTRSWRVPELLPHLEKLRRLPNFIVYASTDPDTGPPPPGWLEASCVHLDYKPGFRPYTKTIRCPGEMAEEVAGRPIPCQVCRICILGRASVHWETILGVTKRKKL